MQEIEYEGKQWTFYGLGNFIFNAAGRYSTFLVPPFSLALVIDFSIDHDRITPAFSVYPIMSDNTVTNYQPRFGNDKEFASIYHALVLRSLWGTATIIDTSHSRNGLGRHIEFLLRADSPTSH